MKNFSYRYYFSVGKQFVVYKMKPSDKNAQGELTNKIYVGSPDEMPGEIELKKKLTYRASVYDQMLPE